MHPIAPYAIGAFLVTYALHLVADMFPKAWIGSARINTFPLPWSFPGWLSFLWLAAGVYGSGLVISYFFTGGILFDGEHIRSVVFVWWASAIHFLGSLVS